VGGQCWFPVFKSVLEALTSPECKLTLLPNTPFLRKYYYSNFKCLTGKGLGRFLAKSKFKNADGMA